MDYSGLACEESIPLRQLALQSEGEQATLLLTEFTKQKGLIAKPILGMYFQAGKFALDREDVLRVFDRLGKIWDLEMIDGGKLVIVMLDSFTSCLKAIKAVSGKKIQLGSDSDSLVITLLHDNEKGQALIQRLKSAKSQRIAAEIDAKRSEDFLTLSREQSISRQSSDLNSSASNASIPTSPATLAHKITSKYEIACFDDDASKAFLLAKRIIGPKGSNMKKIIEACFEDIKFEPDALKLRLRGRGSGFREGPRNEGRQLMTSECNEPLHLCLSAKTALLYTRASTLIEQLLFDVCRAFDIYTAKQENIDPKSRSDNNSSCTRIFRKESSNNHRPELIYPPNQPQRKPKQLQQQPQPSQNSNQGLKARNTNHQGGRSANYKGGQHQSTVSSKHAY